MLRLLDEALVLNQAKLGMPRCGLLSCQERNLCRIISKVHVIEHLLNSINFQGNVIACPRIRKYKELIRIGLDPQLKGKEAFK